MQRTHTAEEKKKLTRWDQVLFWFVLDSFLHARELNIVRDVIDASTLLVKVFDEDRYKPVAVLTYTIEEITRKLNDGGTNDLCSACFAHAISSTSIRRTSS